MHAVPGSLQAAVYCIRGPGHKALGENRQLFFTGHQNCRQSAEYWAQRKGAEVVGLERECVMVCNEQDTGED